MPVLEITRLRVTQSNVAAFLEARPGMLASFEKRPGFVRAQLVKLPGDQWLDLLEWARSEDLAASKTRGGDSPEVAVFFSHIDEVVSSEEGDLSPQ